MSKSDSLNDYHVGVLTGFLHGANAPAPVHQALKSILTHVSSRAGALIGETVTYVPPEPVKPEPPKTWGEQNALPKKIEQALPLKPDKARTEPLIKSEGGYIKWTEQMDDDLRKWKREGKGVVDMVSLLNRFYPEHKFEYGKVNIHIHSLKKKGHWVNDLQPA